MSTAIELTEEEEAELGREAALQEIEMRCVVGYNIKRLRKLRGMKQADLLASSPNVHSLDAARTNSNRVEAGKMAMTLHRVAYLAQLLGTTWRVLMAPPTDAEGKAAVADLVRRRTEERF